LEDTQSKENAVGQKRPRTRLFQTPNKASKASKKQPEQNLFNEFVAALARQDPADFVLFKKSKISHATGLYLRWKQGTYNDSTALELGMDAVTDKDAIRQWKKLKDTTPATARAMLVELHERL
jgi:acyl-CoA-binding protein